MQKGCAARTCPLPGAKKYLVALAAAAKSRKWPETSGKAGIEESLEHPCWPTVYGFFGGPYCHTAPNV